MANREKDLPEQNVLAVDDYEAHILWRAIRQYIALQDVELQECHGGQNNPDVQNVLEMKDRAEMLRDRIDKFDCFKQDDPCAGGWRG